MSHDGEVAAHDVYVHHEDGRTCVLGEDGIWWVPLDAGGEGFTCGRFHGRPVTKPDSITCPRCGMTSYNPSDIRFGYCGNCSDWTTPR